VKHLRDLATRVRFVPLLELFAKVGLATKEIAKEQGKLVGIEVHADGMMLDRFVADRLSESLLHIVRNAVDHGVELPEERRRAGKAASARIKVYAAIGERYLELRVCDDGRGIDLEQVRRQAVESGLLSEAAAEARTAEDLYELLFEPGFSTRTHATQCSGRGIGLDIVRRQIEQVHGSVTLAAGEHSGTEVTLRVPASSCRPAMDS
jgi:two-component system, chemotaxis family, sensor kinase CheA